MSVVERAIDKLRRGSSDPERSATLPAVPTAPIGSLVEPRAVHQSGARIVIDRHALRSAGYLPEAEQDRQFADEYRQIKRSLLANALGSKPVPGRPSARLVMMASALPGEGKTFTSINLALSLARERDTAVVLVDGDVAKPHISRIFGVEAEPGLLDAVADPSVQVESLVIPTDVKGLSILPAGISREGATELLSSNRMSQIASSIASQHPNSIILFDSSPVLVSSESRALASALGQIIVVVRAGRTPRQAVTECLDSLGADKSISLVLNQGRRSLSEGMYGYSYGSYGEEQQS